MLPTATLATTVDSAAELADAEEEAYSITRLLSLVTGSFNGGAKRANPAAGQRLRRYVS